MYLVGLHIYYKMIHGPYYIKYSYISTPPLVFRGLFYSEVYLYPLNKRLGGTQSQCGRFNSRKILPRITNFKAQSKDLTVKCSVNYK